MKNKQKLMIFVVFCLPFFFAFNLTNETTMTPSASSIDAWYETERIISPYETISLDVGAQPYYYYRIYFYCEDGNALIKIRVNITTTNPGMSKGYIDYYSQWDQMCVGIINDDYKTQNVHIVVVESEDGKFYDDKFIELKSKDMNQSSIVYPAMVLSIVLSILSIFLSHKNQKWGKIFIFLTFVAIFITSFDPSGSLNPISESYPYTPTGDTPDTYYYYCSCQFDDSSLSFPLTYQINLLINDSNGIIYFNGTQSFNILDDQNHHFFGSVSISDKNPEELLFHIVDINDTEYNPTINFYEYEDYRAQRLYYRPVDNLINPLCFLSLIISIFNIRFLIKSKKHKKSLKIEDKTTKEQLNEVSCQSDHIASSEPLLSLEKNVNLNPPEPKNLNYNLLNEINFENIPQNLEMQKYFKIYPDHISINTEVNTPDPLRYFVMKIVNFGSLVLICILPVGVIVTISGFNDPLLIDDAFLIILVVVFNLIGIPLIRIIFPNSFNIDLSLIKEIEINPDEIIFHTLKSNKIRKIHCNKIRNINIGLVRGKVPMSFTQPIQSNLSIQFSAGRKGFFVDYVIINSNPLQGLEFQKIFRYLLSNKVFDDVLPKPKVNITIEKPLRNSGLI